MRKSTESLDSVRKLIQEGYSEIARSSSPDGDSRSLAAAGRASCCDHRDLAVTFGYEEEQLRQLPEGCNLGLSCGNPGAISGVRPGEVVLDLGSGAGFDCFVVGPMLGDSGRAIGVDMTPDMVWRARHNLPAYQERTGLDNVEFRLGEIEHLPVADHSVDLVISNCVLNLSTDKPQVWREIARVLRPTGRAAISDLALLRPLPDGVLGSIEAAVGCVAGASPISDLEGMIRASGMELIHLRPRTEYVGAAREARDPLYVRIREGLAPGTDIGDYVTSLDILARPA